MRRARRSLCLLLTGATVAAALGASGCGGDDKPKQGGTQRSNAGDVKGAEGTVRDYLRALVDGDGAAACAKLTPDYRKSVFEQNKDFARQAGATDCASLIDAVTKKTPRTTFEGQPLNKKTVGKIPLKTDVRHSGDEQNATVTGTQGLQRYELFTTKGKWAISDVQQAGG
jgi:hypothetical protein